MSREGEAGEMGESEAMAKVDQEQDVTAGIVRAFEEAAGAGVAAAEDRPSPVSMLDEAFERAQVALGTNVLPFKRSPKEA